MESQKPKKAFRNLFAKTEPDTEQTTEKPNEKQNLNLTSEEERKNPINLAETKSPSLGIEGKFSSMELQTKTSAVELQADSPSIDIDIPAATAVHVSPISIVKDIKKPEKHLEEIKSKATNEINPIDKSAATAYSFVKIQYNLDHFKQERSAWKENDYIEFINRIDQAQTDAFFLKGRLVSEIKEKFYLNNKKGWILFCDEILNMNYTTANQYIRVSQEFDVTSHQRKDFGFEHFKALLPLPQEARDEILNHTPRNLSVKSLRDIVAKKLSGSSLNTQQDNKPVTSKNIVETLQKLKSQLNRLKSVSLSQEEKWQLFGAFQNLSEEMKILSNNFTSTIEIKNEVSMSN